MGCDEKPVYRAFDTAFFAYDLFGSEQIFKALVNGKSHEFPLDYPCKPNESTDLEEPYRSERLVLFKYTETGVLEFLNIVGKIVSAELRHHIGQEQFNEFTVIAFSHLLSDENSAFFQYPEYLFRIVFAVAFITMSKHSSGYGI